MGSVTFCNMINIIIIICKSGRRDLNSGPPAPKAGALPGLRYAPFVEVMKYTVFHIKNQDFFSVFILQLFVVKFFEPALKQFLDD